MPPYCSLIVSLGTSSLLPGQLELIAPVLYLSVVHALHCSPTYTSTHLQVTNDTGRWSPGHLTTSGYRYKGISSLDDGGADNFCLDVYVQGTSMMFPFPTHIKRWSFLFISPDKVLPLSGIMGKLIYHQWGRLLALTSATCKSPYISPSDH